MYNALKAIVQLLESNLIWITFWLLLLFCVGKVIWWWVFTMINTDVKDEENIKENKGNVIKESQNEESSNNNEQTRTKIDLLVNKFIEQLFGSSFE